MWRYRTPGIPDGLFERDERVPITKEEVRAVQISKARLREGDTVYDVGCGSGSVSVEAALQVGASGRVHAVDRDERAVALTQKNLAKFGISNADVHAGDALGVVPGLPEAAAIFVGGMGGATVGVLRLCEQRLARGGRIVIGTILVETLHDVISAMGELAFGEPDITQVTISKSKKTPGGTMMLARNPVTIVSAERQ